MRSRPGGQRVGRFGNRGGVEAGQTDPRNKGLSRRGLLGAAGAGVVLTVLAQPIQGAPITRTVSADPQDCRARADLAEQAIVARHVRALWGLPRMRLGTSTWPHSLVEQTFLQWNYWWQAHLLDCAVDAAHRACTPERMDRVADLARGIRTRNLTGWTNRYYDDMAWLALALDRADRLLDAGFGDAIGELRTALLGGWNPAVGAVPWRIGSDYYNAPAVGPTGLALARSGELARAAELADFLHTRLRDPDTGLILDGVHEPGARTNRAITTYSQGVTIGLETELALRTGESEHYRRAEALIAAVEARLTHGGVITAAAEDDSGLFMGILARYLAEVALSLGHPTAAAIVHTSARAAWANRAEVGGLPLFGADWSRPVTVPGYLGVYPPLAGSFTASANLSRDLSVQLSGWMLLEADCRLTAAGR